MKIRSYSRGASLIEVLIALVIVTVGLLGIAKMQALAIASTRVSTVRSLFAIEAASLASSMHSNRVYWTQVGSGVPTFQAGLNGALLTISTDNNLLNAMPDWPTHCITNVCVGAPMAEYDLLNWGAALQSVMPTATGSIDCAGVPATCTITVNWTETYVGMNASTQYATNQGQAPAATPVSYSLVVQP
ncbi:MAG TPA: type IV pilus modification protein PilV [Burkholderiaceae bacterium]|nr:type IV pilus modification protein PilV [Burkholderiaceae bacterium]